MIIKALLPLIAAIKYKLEHVSGEQFGEQIAQAYKACKEELNKPKPPNHHCVSATTPAQLPFNTCRQD